MFPKLWGGLDAEFLGNFPCPNVSSPAVIQKVDGNPFLGLWVIMACLQHYYLGWN